MISITVKRVFWVTFWAVLALISFYADARATCPSNISTTTADEYQFVSNSEVLHVPSNLVFMRCSIGQQWNGRECAGTPEVFTWQQALAYSQAFVYNDHATWRVPNIKELSLIVERACVRPSINEAVFPQTAPDEYWTATPSTQQNTVWSVAFNNGSSSIKPQSSALHLRLVRYHN